VTTFPQGSSKSADTLELCDAMAGSSPAISALFADLIVARSDGRAPRLPAILERDLLFLCRKPFLSRADVEITRALLEELIAPSLLQTIELTRSIIKTSGYSNADIDRIVFVGGPSKMPWIRERVPRELGIAADLTIDPMTAVAIGAAIFAESREWGASTTRRKATRASTDAGGDIGLKFDYQARTSGEAVRVRLRPDAKAVAARLSVQFDAPERGWTSGRMAVAYDATVDLSARDLGENRFQVTVFDGSGLPLQGAGSTIVITRTHTSAAAIPATQTISVKVRAGATRLNNTLQPIIQKGTPLPANGSQPLKAAYGVGVRFSASASATTTPDYCPARSSRHCRVPPRAREGDNGVDAGADEGRP
jgi:Hsp70 protein